MGNCIQTKNYTSNTEYNNYLGSRVSVSSLSTKDDSPKKNYHSIATAISAFRIVQANNKVDAQKILSKKMSVIKAVQNFDRIHGCRISIGTDRDNYIRKSTPDKKRGLIYKNISHLRSLQSVQVQLNERASTEHEKAEVKGKIQATLEFLGQFTRSEIDYGSPHLTFSMWPRNYDLAGFRHYAWDIETDLSNCKHLDQVLNALVQVSQRDADDMVSTGSIPTNIQSFAINHTACDYTHLPDRPDNSDIPHEITVSFQQGNPNAPAS